MQTQPHQELHNLQLEVSNLQQENARLNHQIDKLKQEMVRIQEVDDEEIQMLYDRISHFKQERDAANQAATVAQQQASEARQQAADVQRRADRALQEAWKRTTAAAQQTAEAKQQADEMQQQADAAVQQAQQQAAEVQKLADAAVRQAKRQVAEAQQQAAEAQRRAGSEVQLREAAQSAKAQTDIELKSMKITLDSLHQALSLAQPKAKEAAGPESKQTATDLCACHHLLQQVQPASDDQIDKPDKVASQKQQPPQQQQPHPPPQQLLEAQPSHQDALLTRLREQEAIISRLQQQLVETQHTAQQAAWELQAVRDYWKCMEKEAAEVKDLKQQVRDLQQSRYTVERRLKAALNEEIKKVEELEEDLYQGRLETKRMKHHYTALTGSL